MSRSFCWWVGRLVVIVLQVCSCRAERKVTYTTRGWGRLVGGGAH